MVNKLSIRGGGKRGKRFWVGFENVLYKLLPSGWQVILSAYIIFYFNEEFWGKYLIHTLLVGILSMIVGWGNTEYLIREFSKRPKNIHLTWIENFSSRVLLLFFALMVTLLSPYSLASKIWMCVWLFSIYWRGGCEIFVLFYRKFKYAILIEIVGISGVMVCIVITGNSMTIENLLAFQAIIHVIKTSAIYFLFTPLKIKPFFANISLNHLKVTLPFFLPVLIGFMETKIDIYIVAFILPNQHLATYHVFISFLVLMRHIAVFFLTPYLKNLYRMRAEALQNVIKRIIPWYLLLAIGYLAVVYIIMVYIYHFELPKYFYLIGFLSNVPFLSYQAKIYTLTNQYRQQAIVKIIFIAVVLEAILCFLIIPYYQLVGALMVHLCVQWVLWIGFKITLRKYENDSA